MECRTTKGLGRPTMDGRGGYCPGKAKDQVGVVDVVIVEEEV